MKVIIKYLLSIIFLFLLNTFNVYANESIKIGLLAPLTGEYDDIGKSIIQSTQDNDARIFILYFNSKNSSGARLQVTLVFPILKTFLYIL